MNGEKREEEVIHERCMTISCVDWFWCAKGAGVLIRGVEETISKAYLTNFTKGRNVPGLWKCYIRCPKDIIFGLQYTIR